MKLIFLISFLSTYLSLPIIIKNAINNKYFAETGGRNSHTGFIPNIGGVAIFFSFFISSILIYCYEMPQINQFIFIFFGSCCMFSVGLLDDLRKFQSFFSKSGYIKIRFLFQIIVAFLTVYFGDVRVSNFYGVLGINEISFISSIFFSTIVLVFLINSFNFIDGIDGLAALISMFILLSFSIIFIKNNNYLDFLIVFSLFFSVLGFFFFNKYPASIFMGDSGSMLIGFLIGCFAIKACSMQITNTGVINPVFILCILSYQSIDTLRVFLLRILSGKSPFMADQNHIHHILIKNNFKHAWVSFFALMYTLVLLTICFYLVEKVALSFFIMVILSILFINLPSSSFSRRIYKKLLKFIK